jgi:hypothetical protein
MVPVLDDADTHVEFLHYPPTGALVRGKPWAIAVDIATNGVSTDTTAWSWRAPIRRPDGDKFDEFTVTTGHTPPEGTVPCRVVLQLDADQTRTIPDGAVVDLAQTAPAARSWWTVTLRVHPN